MKPTIPEKYVFPAAILSVYFFLNAGPLTSFPIHGTAPKRIRHELKGGRQTASERFRQDATISRRMLSGNSLTRAATDSGFPEVFSLPFQNAYSSYSQAVPVQLSSGGLMIVYYFEQEDSFCFSKTLDGGVSWSDPVAITSGFSSAANLQGIRTATGRILLIWVDTWESRLFECHSDDEGESWNTPRQLNVTGPILCSASLGQTADGRIWLFYSRTEDYNPVITVYKTSTDNGMTWGEDHLFLTGGWSDPEISMIQTQTNDIIVIYSEPVLTDSERVLPDSHLNIRTSKDQGLTWSEPERLTGEGARILSPKILLGDDGTIFLVYTNWYSEWLDPDFVNYLTAIEYRILPSGAEEWSEPVRMTRYLGVNSVIDACIYDGLPFIVFSSYRSESYAGPLWAGLAGHSVDLNPPPVLIGGRYPEYRSTRMAMLQAVADDETGVESVTYTFIKNNEQTIHGPFPMNDDGQYPDSTAGDKIWSALVGPLDRDEIITIKYQISDLQSNFIEVYGGLYMIPPVQDAGNIIVQILDNSSIGDWSEEIMSAYWPKTGGGGYLRIGGLWVGSIVRGQKRVNSCDFFQCDWMKTDSTLFTFNPGVSDLDVDATYDDQLAWPAPIGMRVHQRSFQWSDSTRDDFILFDYIIHNTGVNGDLDSLYAALWTNPDVGWDDNDNNLAGYDADRNMAYAYNPYGEPSGYFGIRFLGGRKKPHSVVGYSMDEYNSWPGMTDETRYNYLSAAGIDLPSEPLDLCLLISAPPFSLAPGDSAVVSFGIVLGNGLAELQTNADTMAAIYSHMYPTSVEDRGLATQAPLSFHLEQNHPNPFNPSTTIGFRLPSAERVTVYVYDIMGREVAELADREMPAGFHTLEWNASGFESGVYFCRIQTGEFTAVRKMVLMR